MKISPFRGGRGGLCTSREGAFPPPLCLFSNFLFTLTSALRDPLSQQHHQHLFPGPCRQGLRGLPREGSFTAGSGGDRQGLRWKGCGEGKACREMPGHPNVLRSSDHHRDGPREGSRSPSGFYTPPPHRCRRKSWQGNLKETRRKIQRCGAFFGEEHSKLVAFKPKILVTFYHLSLQIGTLHLQFPLLKNPREFPSFMQQPREILQMLYR